MTVRLEQLRETLLKQQVGKDGTFAVRADPSELVLRLLGAMFPQFRGRADLEIEDLKGLHALASSTASALHTPIPEGAVDKVVSALPKVQATLNLDAQAIFEGDPAARSVDEVIVAYPGFFAIAIFRVAHEFHLATVPVLPRVLTEYAHEKTGIDIHPGATIGEGFCIDHGTGIVIGETTTVGKRVKLYQGVTLGALSVHKSGANTKRHPTVEDNVVIYSNATVLGGETTIGHDSVIGGNVWLTESVPPHTVLYHKSEVIVRNNRGS